MDLKKMIKEKGYKLKDIAKIWGITPRQMSYIIKNPRKIHYWAIHGLPEKTKFQQYYNQLFENLE